MRLDDLHVNEAPLCGLEVRPCIGDCHVGHRLSPSQVRVDGMFTVRESRENEPLFAIAVTDSHDLGFVALHRVTE